MSISNSTVSGNMASIGGGIFVESNPQNSAQAGLTFTTIYSNTADSGGDIAIKFQWK